MYAKCKLTRAHTTAPNTTSWTATSVTQPASASESVGLFCVQRRLRRAAGRRHYQGDRHGSQVRFRTGSHTVDSTGLGRSHFTRATEVRQPKRPHLPSISDCGNGGFLFARDRPPLTMEVRLCQPNFWPSWFSTIRDHFLRKLGEIRWHGPNFGGLPEMRSADLKR
jgi:hypothetical protein